MMIEQALKRVREYARQKGLSKSAFARAAGLNDTTLRGINRDDWNPTAETLRRLESVIPKNWKG